MRFTFSTSTKKSALHVACAAAALAIISADVSGQRPKFYPDDPIATAPDTQDASGVLRKDVNLVYDEGRNLLGNPGDCGHHVS